ncbi:nickel pincer cofactor biosynthesis protein LarB [Leptolyngbya sp. FACHB-321]|uniref:nickel pincer cofactor biosynthesis protein LarB n=1 Tax=Leptolyngbya sp. FACHB-321 TaxID=2692807 RepID=UPI001684F6BB|nr:nickel pincer cofactor biosynthesis protein LarB [Leptolyngbya sp. FACHB-321]
MTQPDQLKRLLHAVAAGELTPELAFDTLKHLDFETVEDFARIDHHRAIRTGFPEVIWGPGKTPDQIAQIMEVMRDRTAVVMATRIEPDVYTQLKAKVPDVEYYATARICALKSNQKAEGRRQKAEGSEQSHPTPHSPLPTHPGTINILSAGTADLPVAEEAAITATLCGFKVNRLWDVGVSGIHRLLENRWAIVEADVLIVVAGMEGALPSVVAGLADCPIVAVPTSVGYGASFNGLAPLLTMLNSCAAGVGVVNIDNGFGAAILAGQILRTANRLRDRLTVEG